MSYLSPGLVPLAVVQFRINIINLHLCGQPAGYPSAPVSSVSPHCPTSCNRWLTYLSHSLVLRALFARTDYWINEVCSVIL